MSYQRKSNAGLVLAIAVVILIILIGVAAIMMMRPPARSPITYNPSTGQSIISHQDPRTGEVIQVPTDTDQTTGEPLYNCRCESRTGSTCSGGAVRGTQIKNIPESTMLSQYKPCSPSTSGWFCTTTVAGSSYCKINNLPEQAM